MELTAKAKLQSRATELKKACIFLCALIGQADEVFETVPNYSGLKTRELRNEVNILKADYLKLFKRAFRLRTNAERLARLKVLAELFDSFDQSGRGRFFAGTAFELEESVGAIRSDNNLDIPPYAEVIVQGFQGVAFRHPEYMLSRDLELSYNLFTQANSLINSTGPKVRIEGWIRSAVVNAISLGRLTIICCFNLLEATVNGISRAYIMLHPEADVKKLVKHGFLAMNHSGLADTQSPVAETVAIAEISSANSYF